MQSHFQESANDRFTPTISLPWMAARGRLLPALSGRSPALVVVRIADANPYFW